MTKRDFFILIIKLFGLFSLVTSLFSVLPNTISYAMMQFNLLSIVWIVVAVLVVIGLFIVLIFKADRVVELLKLDRGYDENRIELGNIRPADIIKMGTFIIGGFLLIDNIPGFLSRIYFAFSSGMLGMVYPTQDKFYLAVSGLNVVLGYLLLTNYNVVAKKMKTEKKEKE